MNMDILLAVLITLVLRLVVPLAITLLVIYLLRKADFRWQKEAAQALELGGEKPQCWEVKNCSMEEMRSCPALVSPEPCWQARRLSNGDLREECLECRVFHQTPVPTPIHL